MRHAIWALALWFGLLLHTAVPLQAEIRIALIIGNGSYTAMDPLESPVSDAQSMARTLEGLGFQVMLVSDSDKTAISQAVAGFGSALRDAGAEATGLFYYAGHAVQSQGRNYLLPVDAAVKNAADLDLLAIDAELVLRQMTSAGNRTGIFILNANRASPLGGLPGLADSGLAAMEPPPGTFLAFAAAPGAVSTEDGPGSSTFAKALAALMISQGMPIEEVFHEVSVAVQEMSGGVQTPWFASSLTGDFTFAVAASSPDEDKLWADIKGSGDPVLFRFFLESYPATGRRAEAEALLKSAEEALAAAAAATQVPAEAAAPVEALDLPGQVPADLQAAIAAADVTFAGAITVGSEAIIGKSIKELITATPLFAPIEGLPDEAWTGLECANCHQWEPVALCDQGKFYLAQDPPEAMEAQHPLGGAFKLNLKRWAELGCN